MKGLKSKTYNSRYSPLVTHEITNLPIRSFSAGDRTGSALSFDLWSYVLDEVQVDSYEA